MESVLVSWSSGKDSCMALYEILASRKYHVAALLSTLTREDDAVGIHFLRRSLLERQAESLRLPLCKVYLSRGAGNQEYEAKLTEALASYRDKGVSGMVFGDLFLEDVRNFREALLPRTGLSGIYPLWKRDTAELIRRFIALGFKAIITSVDARVLDRSFAGQILDADLLAGLPPYVDPCGENGEFHTFVFDGPLFERAIKFTTGETAMKDGHYFCDLLPA
ncbi:MAG TPA: diphthine--ammonia ligase [Blastocatellia bacterium]|nr:diphthine--ammonia ligase [Blastocatellia bacterium]